MISYLCF